MVWIQCAMIAFVWMIDPSPQEEKKIVNNNSNLVLWSMDLKAPSYGSAAAGDLNGDGRPDIVFGTYFNDEHVYAVNGADGKSLWNQKSRGGPCDASVLVVDVNGDGRNEALFADSAYGTFFCLDGSGRTLWTYDSPSGTDSPPAAADLNGDGKIEIVYGTMKDREGAGYVVCLEGATGKPVWSAKVPGHVQSEPALVDVDGDKTIDVLVTNWMGDNKLRALSGKDGHELWTFDIGDWVYHGVSAFDFDKDGKPEIIVADRRGTVWMLRAATGEKLWETRLEGESEGMVFGPTTLVDVDRDGTPEIVVCGLNVHLLDAKGRIRWTRPAVARHSIARGVSAADIDGDGMEELVYGDGTTLRIVSAAKGDELWSMDLKSGTDAFEGIDHAPLLLDLDGDGRLEVFVVCGRGLSGNDEKTHLRGNYGRAYALRAPAWSPAPVAPATTAVASTPAKGGAVSPGREWLTFRGNARRTGLRTP